MSYYEKYEKKLLPCPTCGYDRPVIQRQASGLYSIVCPRYSCGRVYTMFYPTIDQAVEEWNNEKRQKDIFKAQYTQGYEQGTIDAYHANADDLARLKAENNRLTAELEKAYELINSMRAERSRQACPFGDDRETCAFYKANGCDFCKLAIK